MCRTAEKWDLLKKGVEMIKISYAVATGLVLLFANSNVTAQQQVFRCINAAGKIAFSDSPCGGATTGGRIAVQENSLDFSGSRESQLRRENEQLKEQLRDQHRLATSNGNAPQRTQPDLQAERIDSIACERAKRDYEVTASSTANSSAVIESKRSIMYGTCGMREPNKSTVNVDTRVNNFIR